jgi:hypothetical protein
MISLLELYVGEEVRLRQGIPIDDCGTYRDVMIKVEMPFDESTTQTYVLSKHGRSLYRVRLDAPLKDGRLIVVTKPDILWLEPEQGGKSDEERVRALTVVVGKVLELPVSVQIEDGDDSYGEVAARVGYVGDENFMFSADDDDYRLVCTNPKALANNEDLLVLFGPGIIPSMPLETGAPAVAANLPHDPGSSSG